MFTSRHRIILLAVAVASVVSPARADQNCTAVRPVIVVDNNDAGFSTTGGDWNPSTRDKDFYGTGYLWHAKGTGQAKAVWQAQLPKPGRYNVYARWVMSKPDDRATNAPFTVKALDKQETIRVDMTRPQAVTQSNAWNRLGTYDFHKIAEVVLTNDSDNSVVADAIKFEYMEPLDAPQPKRGKLLFKDDCDKMDNWFIEGLGEGKIVDGKLRLDNPDDKLGAHAWFRPELPDNIIIDCDMTIHTSSGLILMFLSAHGSEGEDIITELPPRRGNFGAYRSNPRFLTYHFSLHRVAYDNWEQGVHFRKNPPFTALQRNAIDPCPPKQGDQTHHVTIVKMGPRIQMFVDGKLVIFYIDDTDSRPVYEGGKFGFRHRYRTIVSYDNLRVHEAIMPHACPATKKAACSEN